VEFLTNQQKKERKKEKLQGNCFILFTRTNFFDTIYAIRKKYFELHNVFGILFYLKLKIKQKIM